MVVKHCTRIEALFKAITSLKSGPSIRILVLLVTSILRIILCSRSSSPYETIYSDVSMTPVSFHRSCLSWKYVINLSGKPNNSTFATAKCLSGQDLKSHAWSRQSTRLKENMFLCLHPGVRKRYRNICIYRSLRSPRTPLHGYPWTKSRRREIERRLSRFLSRYSEPFLTIRSSRIPTAPCHKIG